jgi:CubicO group peptidase (beta-lactamase class C family)
VSKTEEYALELTADQGHIFHPLFMKYTPVAERVLVSEVHECYYNGALLANIEHILYFEPTESEFGQCGEPGFGNFRVPANLPASAGTVSTPRDGATWDVTNFVGKMDCGSLNMPLKPNRESGSIEVQDDGDTLIAIGFNEGTATLTMHAVPGITGRYAGSVGGSQDDIPMTINFCWQLITDEWITGYLRSEVNTQGMTCKMSRDSELKVSGQ